MIPTAFRKSTRRRVEGSVGSVLTRDVSARRGVTQHKMALRWKAVGGLGRSGAQKGTIKELSPVKAVNAEMDEEKTFSSQIIEAKREELRQSQLDASRRKDDYRAALLEYARNAPRFQRVTTCAC